MSIEHSTPGTIYDPKTTTRHWGFIPPKPDEHLHYEMDHRIELPPVQNRRQLLNALTNACCGD